MLFNDWTGVVRVIVIAIAAYAALILGLRASGKRTLSKLNAFDLVVTVALGSSFATVILSRDVPLVEGVLSFVMLALMQFVCTWSARRSRWVRRLIKSEPTLLYFRGEFRDPALRAQRLTRDEIRAAVRVHGLGSLAAVAAVVLETSGELSVISELASGDLDALSDVEAHGPQRDA